MYDMYSSIDAAPTLFFRQIFWRRCLALPLCPRHICCSTNHLSPSVSKKMLDDFGVIFHYPSVTPTFIFFLRYWFILMYVMPAVPFSLLLILPWWCFWTTTNHQSQWPCACPLPLFWLKLQLIILQPLRDHCVGGNCSGLSRHTNLSFVHASVDRA